MRQLFLIVILTMNFCAFSQDDKTVTLTVTGQGQTKDEAKQNALRDAIEQAFGTFISSNTEILNDELLKDEIVSVSNGNIKNYKIISEIKIPDIGYAVSLKAEVSVSKLTAFVKSKGVEVEFKGSLLFANVKQQMLNEKNEIKTIKNIVKVSKEILFKSYDYELERGEPKQSENVDYVRGKYGSKVKVAVNDWSIPLTVNVKFNENIENFNSYLHNSLKALSMSKDEIERYNQLGKKTFKIIIGNTIDTGFGGVVKSIFLFGKNSFSIRANPGYYGSSYKNGRAEWLNLKKENLTYRINSLFCEDYNKETNNLDTLKFWLKKMYKESYRNSQCSNVPVLYYRKNPERLLVFRTQDAVNSTIELIYQHRKGLLNFEIDNGLSPFKGRDFIFCLTKSCKWRKKYNNESFEEHRRRFPTPEKIAKSKPKFNFSYVNPIVSYKFSLNKRIVDNLFNWCRYSNYQEDCGYYPFSLTNLDFLNWKMGLMRTLKHKEISQYAFLYEYIKNENANYTAVVASISDFKFTNENIFSFSFHDILTLSDLEKVQGYKITPVSKK